MRSSHWVGQYSSARKAYRTHEYSTSRQFQPWGIPQYLEKGHDEAATSRVACNDNAFGVDGVVWRARRWVHEVEVCREAVLKRARERVLWCFCLLVEEAPSVPSLR